MALSLDHIVIAVHDLEQAITDYRALGFTVVYGGEHASGSTHNALICFEDGTYLELLAPTGKAARAGAVDFSPLLQRGEGIAAYALAANELDADAAALRQRGIRVSEVRDGGRKREDGVELRWKTASIDDGMSPFLIQDVTPRALRVPADAATTTHANGTHGIHALIVSPGSAADAIDWFARLLGVTPEYNPETRRYTYTLGSSLIILNLADAERARSFKLWIATDSEARFEPANTHAVTFVARGE